MVDTRIFVELETKLNENGYKLDNHLEVKQLNLRNTYMVLTVDNKIADTKEDYKKLSGILRDLFDENFVADTGWNVLSVKKQETFRLLDIVVKHQLEKRQNIIQHTIKLDFS